LVKQTFKQIGGLTLDLDKRWHQALHDGFVPDTSWAAVVPSRTSFKVSPVDPKAFAARGDNGSLELTFWPDSHAYDGRFANNGWLQELPDFMTKWAWNIRPS
jgi:hypothetical protein